MLLVMSESELRVRASRGPGPEWSRLRLEAPRHFTTCFPNTVSDHRRREGSYDDMFSLHKTLFEYFYPSKGSIKRTGRVMNFSPSQ